MWQLSGCCYGNQDAMILMAGKYWPLSQPPYLSADRCDSWAVVAMVTKPPWYLWRVNIGHYLGVLASWYMWQLSGCCHGNQATMILKVGKDWALSRPPCLSVDICDSWAVVAMVTKLPCLFADLCIMWQLSDCCHHRLGYDRKITKAPWFK